MQNLSHMTNGYIPIALLPRETLVQILEAIGRQQLRSADMLSLAIPLTRVLSYYEMPLLKSVTSDELGLTFTVSIPMASKSTVLNIYQPQLIPMPTENNRASVWDIEAPYIAVMENRQYAALLTESEFQDCVGSRSYGICENGFSLQRNKNSCPRALLFRDEYAAIQNCRVKSIHLPQKEAATNLGHGRWL